MHSVPDSRFDVSINRRLPGQKLGMLHQDKRWSGYNSSFRQEQHAPASLLEEIKKGHAFCAVLGGCQREHCGQWCCPDRRKAKDPSHCGRPKGHRAGWHFVSSQTLALDFDKGNLSLTDLRADPFIASHASFVYSTLSYTEEDRKWRVVFVLTEPITDAARYCQAETALLQKFGDSDQSIKDAARFLYGSRPTGVHSFLGNLMPMTVVDELTQQYQADLKNQQARRLLPKISPSQIMGSTPGERYASAAVQQETQWVASQTEGSGERHRGLLIAAMKLGSLKLSGWLPANVRDAIDPYELLLLAAQANGYAEKYGEPDAVRTIQDGISYAAPRPDPNALSHTQPKLRRSGGQWVKAVKT